MRIGRIWYSSRADLFLDCGYRPREAPLPSAHFGGDLFVRWNLRGQRAKDQRFQRPMLGKNATDGMKVWQTLKREFIEHGPRVEFHAACVRRAETEKREGADVAEKCLEQIVPPVTGELREVLIGECQSQSELARFGQHRGERVRQKILRLVHVN